MPEAHLAPFPRQLQSAQQFQPAEHICNDAVGTEVPHQRLVHLGPERPSGTVMAFSTRTINLVNAKYGRGAIKTVAEGVRQDWQMRRVLKSPGYLHPWKDFLEVK